MPKRNSPQEIQSLDDLTNIDEMVFDKRNAKRSHEKGAGATGTIKISL